MAKPNIKIPDLSVQDIERFWSKVKTSGPDDCWKWIGAKFKMDYGAYKAKGKNLRASRVAYFLATGNDPGDMMVCHRCDNPPCCNPAHLFLGDNSANIIDCRDKGRMHPLCGDHHGLRRHPEAAPKGDRHWMRRDPVKGSSTYNSAFNPDAVKRIRNEYADGGISQAKLAAKYHVHPESMRKMLVRITWSHVA